MRLDELQLDSGPEPLLAGAEPVLEAEGDQAPPEYDTERESAEEVSAVLSSFQDRARVEAARFAEATDTEYWFALCFQTREQKEEFLRRLDLLDLGDKYLDGMAVAEKLGVKLESPVPDLRRQRHLKGIEDLILE